MYWSSKCIHSSYGHPPRRVLLSLLFFFFLAKKIKRIAEGHGIKWICVSPKPIVILVGTQSYTLERKRSFQILVVWDRGCSRNKTQWRVWGRKGRAPWGTSTQRCWRVVEQEAGTGSCGPSSAALQWRAAEAALSAASGRPPENGD